MISHEEARERGLGPARGIVILTLLYALVVAIAVAGFLVAEVVS